MRKFLNSGLFLAAISLFFLPFLELRCSDGSRFAHLKGVDMAFARGIQFESEETEAYFEENPQMMQQLNKQNKPDVFTLASLLLLFAGMVSPFIPKAARPLLSMLFSGLSLAVLLAMMYMVNYVWNKQTASLSDNPFFQKMFVVNLVYGIGLWLVLGICFFIFILNWVFLHQDKKISHLQKSQSEESQWR